ncbi:hypothetical protein [Gordonia rhizosphera]|uniref:Uncharacterized protein n=1 Tax=Gordonia rhizosphera NBRC 16068 TaxID=1108045 RepID=K6WGX1_9ACTN|nr:hypothetical protein [Gordonia rhizosphera]GAB91397.1 hypothetical protein GORHZ_130_00200 [Gordonia rhizosphera NBRC 16068]
MTIHDVATVADAVLYEGYLLYPYRSTATKNQSRWQFGVLGPPGAVEAGIGEDPSISAQILVRGTAATVALTVRFLHLQHRVVRDAQSRPVDELVVDARRYVSWDEAVACEVPVGPFALGELLPTEVSRPVDVDSAESVEDFGAGSLLRTRVALHGQLTVSADGDGDIARLTVTVTNTGSAATDADDAISRSFIGAHVIAEVRDGTFVSLIDPPDEFAEAARRCEHHRAFPVLAGPPDDDHTVLISPIILYDHPEVADQSQVELFDSTEIDEILTLRVMTMTDEEKEQARATDARAAAIIDRCEVLSPESMARLHGVLRDPHLPGSIATQTPGAPARLVPEIPDGTNWWDPAADLAVEPMSDAVVVDGVAVRRGSRVRLRPSRRADAHDLFFAGMTARVMTVHADVDGQTHVGVVIEDDPAAELHESYGRYYYFAPDEVEPLDSP